MIVDVDARLCEVDLGASLASWTDEVIPKGVEIRHHGTYSPLYAWMYAYEKRLRSRIDEARGCPLGPWERRLFGPDGVFSEGLSNAFLHGHRRDTSLPIVVSCEVAERGLRLAIRDGGPGFAVADVLAAMRRGASYFHVAGNGLRALQQDPDIVAFFADGGRTLRLAVPLHGARDVAASAAPSSCADSDAVTAGADAPASTRADEGPAAEPDHSLFALYDLAPMIMVELDERGAVVRANRAAAALHARPGAQLEGLQWGMAARCIHALMDPRGCGFSEACHTCMVRGTIEATLSSGIAQRRVPARLVRDARAGGGRLHLLVSTVPLETRNGRRILVYVEDVTSLAEAESSLNETEARFRTLVEHAPAAIVIFDEAGTIVMANAACEALFGYSRAEIVGLKAGSLIPEIAERTSSDGAAASRGLVGARHRDGTQFPVEVCLSSAETEQGRWVIEHIVDARPRLAADRAKREFVSVVSHELRTPLTSIRGSLGLLAAGVAGSLPEKAQSMVAIALANGERLLRLINDILDMDKLESSQARFELRRVDLALLSDSAIESNRGFAEQYGVRLRYERPEGPLPALADPDRLLQVLANLLSNAVKYSPAGGEVVVSAGRCGSRVRVSVTNNGPSIPEEFRQTIFEKFTQADSSAGRRRDGTGLGLAISKAIIERHGGEIGFETSSGATTFSFEVLGA